MNSSIVKNKENVCIFCESKLEKLFSINNMPVFMGVVEKINSKSVIKNDLTYCKCKKCNCVQIKEKINSDILYRNNHNLDVVGKLWLNHYEEFYKFIKNDIKNKIVLEIGDPSCKIAKFANEDVKSWSIIEKNVNHSVKLNNVFFIKDWFDKRYVNKCDIIIHSHVLEHMFDIKSFLKTLNKCLELNGKMFFSVPNFDYLLKKTFLPVNLLHFEHTFCFTRKLLVKLLLAFGFKVNRVFNYKNHSLFFECRKISSNILEKYFIKTCKTHYKSFIFNYKRVKMLVNKFNNIDVCEKFIFSSHVSTQFMISAGLNLKNVKYLLDNSEKKQNKYLYGVDVIIKSPDIIKNIKNPVVLISHCSIYKKEISKQLRKLNKGVILI